MSPSVLIREAAADGVNLALSSAGAIKAVGDQAAVNRWLPILREHKPAILAALAHLDLPGVPPSSRPACPPRTWRTSRPATFRWGPSRRSRRRPSPGKPRTSAKPSRSGLASCSSTPACPGPMPSFRPPGSRRAWRGIGGIYGRPCDRPWRTPPPCWPTYPTSPARWTASH
jgi:hypothetical protein